MFNNYLSEYTPFLFLFFLSSIIAVILLTLNFLIGKSVKKNSIDTEKLSAYECGFEPFEEARIQFNVHYYVVAILFLIFDIEIIYLFPCVNILTELTFNGLFSLMYFITILTIGFIYEWYVGALKW